MPAQADRVALLLAKKSDLHPKQTKLQTKIDRLNEAENKLANSRKTLWGADLLDEAEKDLKFAAWAATKANEYFTRRVDKNRIAPDLVRFRANPQPLSNEGNKLS
jgi:hypothetical protein